jgi:DNA primase catalytic core
MIEQEKIDRIKTTVDMIALAEAKGVHMKKNGRAWFGLCPFHNDKNPSLSINPKTNLWQCFGCGAGGDVIRFIELFDGVDFSEAVKRLSDNGYHQRPADNPPQKAPDKPTPPLTVEQIKLLTRVIEFYHTAFAQSPQAGEYLSGRGITEKSLYADYKLGLADGRLLDTLPKKGGIKDQLKELGILNQKGTEHFYGCLVFPVFDADNNPCGLYGRRIQGAGSDHLYLPGPRRGVFNWQAAKAHKEIILTESIIDSLTLINAGIKNTIPCYGVNGLTRDHMELFKQQNTEAILICFDADAPGKNAAQELKHTLENQGIHTDMIMLPDDQDINEFFLLTADPVNHFKALLPQAVQNASPAAEGHAQGVIKEETPAQEKNIITRTDFGFVLITDGRTYEVRGLCRRDNKLKATVKGIKQEGAKKRLHIDTVDFYSARSRSYLVKGLCDLFGAEDQTITRDIETLLARAEQYHQPESRPDEQKPAMTEKERAEALRFLKNPDMFDEILTDIETLGYTGEEMNKLLCYVAAVSRKMDSPLSVMIQSRSAAGKSFLQDTILSLIPEEDKTKYTRLTDQALFYTDRGSNVGRPLYFYI